MWESLCSETLCPLRNPVLTVPLCPIFHLSALRNRGHTPFPEFVSQYPGPSNFFHEIFFFFCLMWLSLEEAKRMKRRREGDGLRVLSSWAQMGLPSSGSCNASAKETSSQSRVFPELRIPFHWDTVPLQSCMVSWALCFRILSHWDTFSPQNCMVSGLLSPRIPTHLGRIHFLIQLHGD